MGKYKRGVYPSSDSEKSARIGTLLDSLKSENKAILNSDSEVKEQEKISQPSGWRALFKIK